MEDKKLHFVHPLPGWGGMALESLRQLGERELPKTLQPVGNRSLAALPVRKSNLASLHSPKLPILAPACWSSREAAICRNPGGSSALPYHCGVHSPVHSFLKHQVTCQRGAGFLRGGFFSGMLLTRTILPLHPFPAELARVQWWEDSYFPGSSGPGIRSPDQDLQFQTSCLWQSRMYEVKNPRSLSGNPFYIEGQTKCSVVLFL